MNGVVFWNLSSERCTGESGWALNSSFFWRFKWCFQPLVAFNYSQTKSSQWGLRRGVLYQPLKLNLLSIVVLDLSETHNDIDFLFTLTFLSFIFAQCKPFANGSWAVLNIVLLVSTIWLSENANVKARLWSSNPRVSFSLVLNCNTWLIFCVVLTLNPKHRSLWKISPELEFGVFF